MDRGVRVLNCLVEELLSDVRTRWSILLFEFILMYQLDFLDKPAKFPVNSLRFSTTFIDCYRLSVHFSQITLVLMVQLLV